MKFLLLTSPTNRFCTNIALMLIKEKNFKVRFIFLDHLGKGSFSWENLRKQIIRSGVSFLSMKLIDVLLLTFRKWICVLGIQRHPIYPAEVAIQNNIHVDSVLDINANKSLIKIKEFEPDYLITVGFGQILGEEALNIAILESVNIHPSFLPKHKGSNPFREILKAGDSTTGVTIHRLTKVVDSGEILEQVSYKVPPDPNQWKLRALASIKGADALKKLLVKLSEK
jgi:hypothetical protein